MAIPGFQQMMVPLLRLTNEQQVHTAKEAVNKLAQYFELTEEDRQTLNQKTRQLKFDNRVHWAIFYLKRTLLLTNSEAGRFSLGERGLKVLEDKLDYIDLKYLRQFSEFPRSSKDKSPQTDQEVDIETPTMDEIGLVTKSPEATSNQDKANVAGHNQVTVDSQWRLQANERTRQVLDWLRGLGMVALDFRLTTRTVVQSPGCDVRLGEVSLLHFRNDGATQTYVVLTGYSEGEAVRLKEGLSQSEQVYELEEMRYFPNEPNLRLIVATDEDFALLQQVTEKIVERTLTNPASPTIEDTPDDADTFEEPVEVSNPEEQPSLASLETWLGSFTNKYDNVRQFATDYPRWLVETFGEQLEIVFWPPNPKGGGELMVKIKGRYRQQSVFNRGKSYFYTLLYDPTQEELDYLRSQLFWPDQLLPKTPYVVDRTGSQGWRCAIHTEQDYTALKEVVRRMVEREYGPVSLFDTPSLNELIEQFRYQYTDFNSPDYLKQERDYKLSVVRKFQEQLGRAALDQLIAQGNFEEVRRRLKYIANTANLLNQFDTRPLQTDDAKKLTQAFYRFLYRDAPLEARFQSWMDFLLSVPSKAGTKAGLWPLATYYLMLADPQRYIFVKPTPFDDFLLRVNSPLQDQRPSRANALFYNRLLELSRQLLPQLVPLGARDMIDVQSFIWITSKEAVVEPDPDPKPVSLLPDSWSKLADFRDFALSLTMGKSYTAQELHEVAQRFGRGYSANNDPMDLAYDLQQLRLVKDTNWFVYKLQDYVLPGDSAVLLKVMALGLLLPKEDEGGGYYLPIKALLTHFGDLINSEVSVEASQEKLNAGLDKISQELIKETGWYDEAGIFNYGLYNLEHEREVSFTLELLKETDPASVLYNQMVTALIGMQPQLSGVDGALPSLSMEDLDARIREMSRQLLIDPLVVKRVYTSLISGRHVVLSGPPGTGKTELAKLLPSLLWREQGEDKLVLTLDPDKPPVEPESQVRHGYRVNVVTATEDWGVRDVVGGIGPRLDDEGGKLQYRIEYGHLTRAVLQNYAGTANGRRLPPTATETNQSRREEYQDDRGRRYRGVWLVIDEFTRAPVDAAFGSLLTTLGGGEAVLAVPTGGGSETAVSVPSDFRIIGTLNSFDRHFLNQISEAIKRRFNFIDVLPPAPRYARYEQGIAVNKALEKLHKQGLGQVEKGEEAGTYRWSGMAAVRLEEVDGYSRPVLNDGDEWAALPTLRTFWNIFRAIRVFRQLGTAQAETVYTNLLVSYTVIGDWWQALDIALADTLADQLQVLSRDEQKILLAYLEASDAPAELLKKVQTILDSMPPNRLQDMLAILRRAYNGLAKAGQEWQATSQPQPPGLEKLTSQQLETVFTLSRKLLPQLQNSIFYTRLSNLVSERGL